MLPPLPPPPLYPLVASVRLLRLMRSCPSTRNLLCPGILHPIASPRPHICPPEPLEQPLSEPFGCYGRRATLPAQARTRIAAQHVPTMPATHGGGTGPSTEPLCHL